MAGNSRLNRTRCCICKEMFSGYGNNPFPIKNKGRCCDNCDETIVIPKRIRRIRK